MDRIGQFLAELARDPLQQLLLLAVALLAGLAVVCCRRWTLFRYILMDLVKHFVLATTVLVLVISAGVAIKPLSDGLLGPVGLLKFILCSAPTMLQFAAPFSGAFAATMVFTRMSSDNEILACSAGGMSYRRILLPVVVLGLGLMLAMFYLGNWVAPRFYAVAVHALETDVTQVLVAQMNKRQTISLPGGKWVLYADGGQERALAQEDAPQLGLGPDVVPERWVQLQHVVVGQVTADGWLEHDVSAQTADVLMYRRDGRSFVRIMLDRGVHGDRSGRTMGGREAQLLEFPLQAPLLDKPEAMSWPDLQEIRAAPERYDLIRRAKTSLALVVGAEQVLQAIRDEMASKYVLGQGVVLTGMKDEQYVVRSPVAVLDQMQLKLAGAPGAPVRVDHVVRGTVVQQDVAPSGTITVSLDVLEALPRVQVTLVQAHSINPAAAGVATDKAQFVLPPAFWRTPELAEVQKLSMKDLRDLARGDALHPAPKQVAQVRADVEQTWDLLLREILAQMHQRAAAAVVCPLVLLLGACWSVYFRVKLPLDVYSRCFLAVLLVEIVWIGGVHATSEPSYPPAVGLAVIWLGVALLAAAAGRGYWKMTRH